MNIPELPPTDLPPQGEGAPLLPPESAALDAPDQEFRAMLAEHGYPVMEPPTNPTEFVSLVVAVANQIQRMIQNGQDHLKRAA